MMIETCSSVE